MSFEDLCLLKEDVFLCRPREMRVPQRSHSTCSFPFESTTMLYSIVIASGSSNTMVSERKWVPEELGVDADMISGGISGDQ